MTRHEREQLDMFPDSPQAREILASQTLTLRARIESLLRNVASSIRPCRKCSKTLYLVVSRSDGKKVVTPYDPDGANHFSTCPFAQDFKRPKQ